MLSGMKTLLQKCPKKVIFLEEPFLNSGELVAGKKIG